MIQIKRIIIWLVILISPTALWFIFTDEGSSAWKKISNVETKTELKSLPVKNNQPVGNNTILIPASPPVTKPRLRVSIKNNQQGFEFPFTVYIEDTNQNKSGYDNSTKQITREINNTNVNINEQNLNIVIHPATSTKYSLKISGNPGGFFRLSVGGVSPTMQSSTTILEGYAANNRTLHYNINLNNLQNIGVGPKRKQNRTSEFISNPTTIVTRYDEISLKETCLKFLYMMKKVPNGVVNVAPDNPCDITYYGKSRKEHFVSPEDLFYPNYNSQSELDGWSPSMEAGGPDGSYF